MTTTPIRLHFQDGCAVSFNFPDAVELVLSTQPAPSFNFDVGTIIYGGVDDYDGPYEVVPSDIVQILPTDGLKMRGDVTVAPIPSNYGLVTYNGSTITVS